MKTHYQVAWNVKLIGGLSLMLKKIVGISDPDEDR